MGKAKRTRMSQRMSQHIMQLKLALCMASSVKQITYRMDMFIPRLLRFVNRFFENAPRGFQPACPRFVPKRTKGIDGSGKIMYNIVKQYVLNLKEALL